MIPLPKQRVEDEVFKEVITSMELIVSAVERSIYQQQLYLPRYISCDTSKTTSAKLKKVQTQTNRRDVLVCEEESSKLSHRKGEAVDDNHILNSIGTMLAITSGLQLMIGFVTAIWVGLSLAGVFLSEFTFGFAYTVAIETFKNATVSKQNLKRVYHASIAMAIATGFGFVVGFDDQFRTCVGAIMLEITLEFVDIVNTFKKVTETIKGDVCCWCSIQLWKHRIRELFHSTNSKMAIAVVFGFLVGSAVGDQFGGYGYTILGEIALGFGDMTEIFQHVIMIVEEIGQISKYFPDVHRCRNITCPGLDK